MGECRELMSLRICIMNNLIYKLKSGNGIGAEGCRWVSEGL